jgi:hypothetical protein
VKEKFMSIRASFLTSMLAAGAILQAQSTSSLQGVISDPQNAVIPEAIVSLSSAGAAASRQVVTGNTGSYQFVQVAPGEYTLTVTKPGFTKATRDHVVLQVNVPATLDVQMEVGITGELVNVTAEATLVSTTDASVGNAFTEHQVRQLPLDTRNVVELLSLQPGVTSTGEVMGARRDQNNITLDGVDVNDNQNSGIGGPHTDGQGSNANLSPSDSPISGFNSVLPIPLDSVQEFRVTVAGQGAEEERSSGGTGGPHHQERHESLAWIGLRIQPPHRIRQQLVQQSQRRRSHASQSQPVRSVARRTHQKRSHLLFLQLRTPYRPK